MPFVNYQCLKWLPLDIDLKCVLIVGHCRNYEKIWPHLYFFSLCCVIQIPQFVSKWWKGVSLQQNTLSCALLLFPDSCFWMWPLHHIVCFCSRVLWFVATTYFFPTIFFPTYFFFLTFFLPFGSHTKNDYHKFFMFLGQISALYRVTFPSAYWVPKLWNHWVQSQTELLSEVKRFPGGNFFHNQSIFVVGT